MTSFRRTLSLVAILLPPLVARVSADESPRTSALVRGSLVRLTSDGRVPIRLAAAAVVGRWGGQDRIDKVGATGKIGPNGILDIRIALAGLPRAAITAVVVKGHGADQWLFPIAADLAQFAAVVDRRPGAPTAEILIEPLRVESGREFYVKLTFADGTESETYFKGGKADPNRRLAGASITASWVGQGALDFAGKGAGVGPDGLQDARISLDKLSRTDKVKGVLIEGPGQVKWAAGLNHELHNNAEFAADPGDPSKGNLFLQPDRDLSQAKLTLTVLYENGKTDATTLVARKIDPNLAMPRVALPRLVPVSYNARWHGQDGSRVLGAGDAHVAVALTPPDRMPVAAVLSDGVRSAWVHRSSDRVPLDVEPDARPLVVKRAKAPGVIDLYFRPYRNLDRQTLTLRLVFEDGSQAVGTINGGPCDPALSAPIPERTEAGARPGDDLQSLANRVGTLRLAAGVHVLQRPLVLSRPIQILGERGAVVEFRQGPSDTPWTTAIKIHRGGTTLRGFAVRFAGPIRWKTDVSWGPAVIGTTDNLDNLPQLEKPNLVFEELSPIGPPAPKATGWEEAPKLMRLLDAPGGRIARNTLLGGPVEFFGGPWVVEGNEFLGTHANTFSPVVFAAHRPFDLIVRNNRSKPRPFGGKTWRFLLLTNRGAGDRIENNQIEGIGPRDDDAIPPMNSPEIILTESYHVRFEGTPSAVSEDGRLLKVARLRGEPPLTGDVVSVLSGPSAGAWRRIAQRLDPTTYLLDSPLPAGARIISITPGFVNDIYEKNTIEARGGRAAAGFVLAGNHYGTRLADNRVIGAGDAFQIMAFPSETPVLWGWTHAPYFGGTFENNVIEDSERGAQIGVLHNGNDKSSQGRTFMTIALKGNTVVWSDAFLSRSPLPQPAGQTFRSGINLGWLPSRDPTELHVTAQGDRLSESVKVKGRTAPAFRVNGAILNGQTLVGKEFPLPLPASPAGRAAAAPGAPRR